MEIKEIKSILDTMKTRLSFRETGFLVTINESGEDFIEFKVTTSDYVLLLVLISEDKVLVTKQGQKLEEADYYNFNDSLQLLSVLITVLFTVYSSYYSFQEYLTFLFQDKIRTWRQLVAVLTEYQIEWETTPNGLVADDLKLEVHNHSFTVSFLGSEYEYTFTDNLELIHLLMDSLSYYYQIQHMEYQYSDESELVSSIESDGIDEEDPSQMGVEGGGDDFIDGDFDTEGPEQLPVEEQPSDEGVETNDMGDLPDDFFEGIE